MYLKPNVVEIKKRRQVYELSKHQVSLKAGLGGQALSRIETGSTKAIHPLRAKQIAKVLKCKVSDIFEEVNRK